MAIGTATIGTTPCCGVIERTWEAVPDEASTTGTNHYPGEFGRLVYHDTPDRPARTEERGPYAPTFTQEQALLDRGICPDCGQRFR